jgi:CubicO group peptidase (beta-lactamase class C family)
MKKTRKDIQRVMDDATARGETPCALALLWRKGEIDFLYGSGHADLGAPTPVCRDTIFRIFSLTKPMTAVAAMTLVERGELDLLAPVSDFLEGFQNQRVALSDTETVPVKRPVQVRDLFSMTSGLCYPGETTPAERAAAQLFKDIDRETAEGSPSDTLTVANRMGRLPLMFNPGERWQYGTSADILGAVIEAVSGKPLDEYMTKNLFAPLGMEDTGFWVPEEKRCRLATLYERKDGILSPYAESPSGENPYFTKPACISGGGGAVSTIDDVLAFARMLLGRGSLGDTRILSPASVDWLSHNHLDAKQRESVYFESMYGYGYGGLMRVLERPAKSFSLGVTGEFGWDGWTGPYMSVCPQEELILLVMQQRTDSGITPLTRKIRNIVFSRVVK